MAKQPGYAFLVELDDAGGAAQDISNDVTNHNFSTPRGVQNSTGVDKAANERILLLADFSATLNGVFNPAANMSHAVLSTVGTATDPRTLRLALADRQLDNESHVTDYQLTRNQDGSFTWTAPASLADGTVPTWMDNS